MAAAENEAEQIGERLATRLADFLQRGGAVDAATAERLLLPSFLCAAGLLPPANRVRASIQL